MKISEWRCPICDSDFSESDTPRESLRGHLVFSTDQQHSDIGELISEVTEISDERRKKISQAIEGSEHSKETKEKISESQPENREPETDLSQDFEIVEREDCPVCQKSFSSKENPYQSLRAHIFGSRDLEHNTNRIRKLQSLLSQAENIPDDVRQVLSDRMTGKTGSDHPMGGKSHTSETKEKIGKSQPDRRPDHPVTGGHSNECSCGSCTKSGSICEWYDIGLESEVQGTWERDIGRSLISQFGIESVEAQVHFNYTVDFVIGDSMAIEVKGYVIPIHIQKAEKFLGEYEDMEYVVIGGEESQQLPCDKHYDKDEVINNGM